MSEATLELSSFFEVSEVDASVFDTYADMAFESVRARERFNVLVKEHAARVERGEGDVLKLALGLLILGQYRDALEWFPKARRDKVRHYYAAQALLALGRLDDAQGELERAAQAGWDAFAIDMQIAAIHLRRGESSPAENLVHRHASHGEDRADWHYVRGSLHEQRDEHERAMEAYEKALTLQPNHTQALFRYARQQDLRGDDEQAVERYQELAEQPRAHVNALINLAVLYEDRGEYEEALDCLQRVLKACPTHRRARLFLKDAESCRQMVIDEVLEKREATRDRLLDAPISEFEVSVRVRNCLKKMRIHTVGDLVKLTEAELLSSKNFGETSLTEIKALLTRKGLRLGQSSEEIDATTLGQEAPPRPPVPPGAEVVLSKSVAELELSVRARRCLQRLNIVTLGNLIQHAEVDLLATRNFGATSLNEIVARLAEFGLKLAPKQNE